MSHIHQFDSWESYLYPPPDDRTVNMVKDGHVFGDVHNGQVDRYLDDIHTEVLYPVFDSIIIDREPDAAKQDIYGGYELTLAQKIELEQAVAKIADYLDNTNKTDDDSDYRNYLEFNTDTTYNHPYTCE